MGITVVVMLHTRINARTQAPALIRHIKLYFCITLFRAQQKLRANSSEKTILHSDKRSFQNYSATPFSTYAMEMDQELIKIAYAISYIVYSVLNMSGWIWAASAYTQFDDMLMSVWLNGILYAAYVCACVCICKWVHCDRSMGFIDIISVIVAFFHRRRHRRHHHHHCSHRIGCRSHRLSYMHKIEQIPQKRIVFVEALQTLAIYYFGLTTGELICLRHKTVKCLNFRCWQKSWAIFFNRISFAISMARL